jgi:hypothetical protein
MMPHDGDTGYLGRVLAHDGRPLGTCFQVAPSVLITAWHVLADAGTSAARDTVLVDPLRAGDAAVATVAAVDRERDLAVLTRAEPLRTSTAGMAASASVRSGTEVAVTGVSRVADKLSYRYLDVVGSWQGRGLRDDQVMLMRMEARGVVQGMSGAPVRLLADGRVAGVVSARYNSGDGWLRDTVWVACTEHVVTLLSGMAEVGLTTATSPLEPLDGESRVDPPPERDFFAVDDYRQIAYLCRLFDGVLLVTERAEHGPGKQNSVKHFRRDDYPKLAPAKSQFNVAIAWYNVGGYDTYFLRGRESPTNLGRFLGERGARHSGLHLFVDGVMVESIKYGFWRKALDVPSLAEVMGRLCAAHLPGRQGA